MCVTDVKYLKDVASQNLNINQKTKNINTQNASLKSSKRKTYFRCTIEHCWHWDCGTMHSFAMGVDYVILNMM